MPKLVFTIDPAGNVAMKVEGVAGPACHTGEESCFHDPLAGESPEPFAALCPVVLQMKLDLAQQFRCGRPIHASVKRS